MRKYLRNILSAFFVVFLYSCKGQSKIDNCEASLTRANKLVNLYAPNFNREGLHSAMLPLDTAMQCEKTRSKAIAAKISLFTVLREYIQGKDFMATLSESDFVLEFQKKMYSDIFIASDYEANDDTLKRNEIYNGTITMIDNYINTHHPEKVQDNKEAYYNLFFIKSRAYDSKKIMNDITDLINKYPSEKVFFEDLKNMALENFLS